MKPLTTLILLLGAGAAQAGETKIARTDVPKPVLATIQKQFPNAKQLGFERETEAGKVVYEANLLDGGRRIDVDVSPEGALLVVEETIKLEAAPDAVRKGLAASKYGKMPVTKSEKVTHYEKEKPTSVAYEFVVGGGARRVEVVLGENGKILKEEPKAAGDDD
jgi:hypothetical protein